MSIPRYPAYKESGINLLNEIPEQWQCTKLQETASGGDNSFVDGPFGSSLKNEEYAEEGVPLIQLNNIGIGSHILRTLNFVSPEKADELGRHNAFPGDLVIAKMADPVARAAIVSDKFRRYVIVADCIRLEPDSSRIDPRFLVYSINSPYFKALAEMASKGIGRIRINLGSLRQLPLYLPPLDVQRQIANFLDSEIAKIDALIAEQQRLIELLQEKRQAVISHAVTKGLNPDAPMKDSGVEWLGEVPEHWELLQLKRLSRPGSSITYGIVQAGPHIEDGIPYIRTSDMAGDSLSIETCQRTSHEIDRSYKRSKVNTGDLVVAIRATVGKVLVVPEELDGANLTQGTAKFSPGNQVLTDFIKLSFESRYLQAQIEASSKGATFAEITLVALRRLVFAVPPIGEQAEIASRVNALVNQFEGLISDSQRSAELLQERRSALISAAVTGQIDVRGLMPKAEAA